MAIRYLPSNLEFPAGELDDFWATGTTVMCWARLDSVVGGNYNRILETDTFWVGRSADRSSFFFFHTSVGNIWWETPVSSVPLDIWHHLSCYWDRSNELDAAVFYIDGVLVSSVLPAGAPVAGAIVNTSAVTIGRGSGGAQYWLGEIDDLRVYDRNVSSTEIQEIYHQRGRDRMYFDMTRRTSITPVASGVILPTTVFDVSPNAADVPTAGSPTAVDGIITPRV